MLMQQRRAELHEDKAMLQVLIDALYTMRSKTQEKQMVVVAQFDAHGKQFFWRKRVLCFQSSESSIGAADARALGLITIATFM